MLPDSIAGSVELHGEGNFTQGLLEQKQPRRDTARLGFLMYTPDHCFLKAAARVWRKAFIADRHSFQRTMDTWPVRRWA